MEGYGYYPPTSPKGKRVFLTLVFQLYTLCTRWGLCATRRALSCQRCYNDARGKYADTTTAS